MIGRKVILSELEVYLKDLIVERTVDRVIVHHFWQPKAADWKGFPTLQSVYDFHVKTKGWSDIGYHLVVGPDSTLWLARPMEQAGAHTVGQNGRSIGIAYAANFDTEDPKSNGYDAGVAACAAIVRRFNCDEGDVYFHRDFTDKTCPGKKMDRERFRRDVAQVLECADEDDYIRLKIDDKLVRGAQITMERGTAVGLQGPIDAALGRGCKTPGKRVTIRKYLKSVRVLISPDGWHREQGPHGTIYAYTQDEA